MLHQIHLPPHSTILKLAKVKEAALSQGFTNGANVSLVVLIKNPSTTIATTTDITTTSVGADVPTREREKQSMRRVSDAIKARVHQRILMRQLAWFV